VKKVSRLDGLEHRAETSFGPDRFVQRHTFVAVEEVELKSFYPFIYSFTPSAETWMAETVQGEIISGRFAQDGSHKPSVACSWLAQFDAATGKGALAYLQTRFSGPRAFMRFWDTKQYHKFLAQPLAGRIPEGTELHYSLVMQFFTATEADWNTVAKGLAAAIAAEFPQAGFQQGKRGPAAGEQQAGGIRCSTEHYAVLFDPQPAWTIRQIEFDGRSIAKPTGWYGTVMVPRGGSWWGTGHGEGGREVVHALKLTVDGQDRPVVPGATCAGTEIRLVKDSSIWKFNCRAEVTITNDHVYERTRLTPNQDCELELLYAFMHCFVPETTAWAAALPDGTVHTGQLDHGGGFSVNRNVRWLAQYEPQLNVGILCYLPGAAGDRAISKIWNQPHYHKHYVQPDTRQIFKQGETLDYVMVLKAVPGETGDWKATKTAASLLEETLSLIAPERSGLTGPAGE